MLWGVMKKIASKVSNSIEKSLHFDQELLDNSVYVFVTKGFLGRSLEVITNIEYERMFMDKFKYKN